MGERGNRDKRAALLEEIRRGIESRVPPRPPEEDCDLEPAGAVRVLPKKKELECIMS